MCWDFHEAGQECSMSSHESGNRSFLPLAMPVWIQPTLKFLFPPWSRMPPLRLPCFCLPKTHQGRMCYSKASVQRNITTAQEVFHQTSQRKLICRWLWICFPLRWLCLSVSMCAHAHCEVNILRTTRFQKAVIGCTFTNVQSLDWTKRWLPWLINVRKHTQKIPYSQFYKYSSNIFMGLDLWAIQHQGYSTVGLQATYGLWVTSVWPILGNTPGTAPESSCWLLDGVLVFAVSLDLTQDPPMLHFWNMCLTIWGFLHFFHHIIMFFHDVFLK